MTIRYEQVSKKCAEEIVIRLRKAYPHIGQLVKGKVADMGNGLCIIELNVLKTDSGECEREIVKIVSEVIIENI